MVLFKSALCAAALLLLPQPSVSAPTGGGGGGESKAKQAVPKSLTVAGVEITDLAFLGEGSESVVYSGRRHGSPVAVKRCVAEARAACLEQVENTRLMLLQGLRGTIPDQYEHDVQGDGVVTIVMGLAAGGTLDADIEAAGSVRWSDADRQQVAVNLFRTLAAWHNKGWAHRDLHPVNIVFGQEDKAAGAGQVLFIDYSHATRENPTSLPSYAHWGLETAPIPQTRVPLVPAIDPRSADTWMLGLTMISWLYASSGSAWPGPADFPWFYLKDGSRNPWPEADKFWKASPGGGSRDGEADRFVDKYCPAPRPAEYKELLLEIFSDDPASRPSPDNIADRLEAMDKEVFGVKHRPGHW